MTWIGKIKNFVIGIVMVAVALLMMVNPDDGYKFIAFVLSFTLLTAGVRGLIYYFTMARYMVGGGTILYRGVIFFDLGIFTLTLTAFPKSYIVLYLVAYHAFLGIVDLMRTRETRKTGSKHWKLNASRGIVNIAMALSCIAYLWRPDVIVYLYALGLAYTGFVQIATAFRRTAMVYIQ